MPLCVGSGMPSRSFLPFVDSSTAMAIVYVYTSSRHVVIRDPLVVMQCSRSESRPALPSACLGCTLDHYSL